MVNSGMRKMVVIKNIPSNLVEEAILILKNEPGAKPPEGKEKVDSSLQKSRDDFLFKEAELIINNYIKESKVIKDKYIGQQKKLGFFKNKCFTNIAINVALIGSLALFIFLLITIL